MKKYLLCYVLFLTLTGCASFEPKSGMTFEQFRGMTALSFNGTVISLGKLSGTNIDIYETFDQNYSRVTRNKSAPAGGWQYFYFSNGRLLDQKDVQSIIEQSAAQQRKIEQEKVDQQRKIEQEKVANEKLISKKNTKGNSGGKTTFTEAILITVAPIHFQTTMFETQKRQWNNNVRFGAAPISAAYLRMINQEVPELYRYFSVCSKKYGGGEINPQTIMNLLDTEESLRMQFALLGLMKGSVQTPTARNLNAASENELVLRLTLNKFQNELNYKTDKNWCDKIKPDNLK